MTVYRFRELRHMEKRFIRCTSCRKRMTRQMTFTQTVNPFNKNADGEPASPAEIYANLRAEGAKWQPDDELCRTCEAAS
jgi:hypothetical protein